MKENDPLNSVLHEWEAPEHSPGMDARVRAAYQAAHRPSLWRRMWTFRVTIPVPVLAALLLIAAVAWLQFRPAPAATITTPSPAGEYLTRIETAGFQIDDDRQKTAKAVCNLGSFGH